MRYVRTLTMGRSMGAYRCWYNSGRFVCGLTRDGGIQTFKERAAEIADHAHNPRGALGEAQDFLRGLDEMERQCRCLGYVRQVLWC